MLLLGGYFALTGSPTAAIFFVWAVWFPALTLFGWRRRGRYRRNYERWSARDAEREVSAGWFADPTGRHVFRSMHHARWTHWVKAARYERRDRIELRSRGLLPAFRGAFVA